VDTSVLPTSGIMIPWLGPHGNADDIEAADGQQPTAVGTNTRPESATCTSPLEARSRLTTCPDAGGHRWSDAGLGNRSWRRRFARGRPWTQVTPPGMLRFVSGPRRALRVPPFAQAAAGVWPRSGASWAPAGGWRMELEFDSGSVASASPMSRPAASPIVELADAGGAGVPVGGRAEGAGEEPS
jgi:hypothetical protein